MLQDAAEYQYVVVNDNLERAAEQVAAIVLAERRKRGRGEITVN
jgi:guanylate kinase